MEEASFWISIIAVVIALSTPLIEYYLTRHLSKKNAISEYARKILGEMIFLDLPKSVFQIHWDGHNVTETDQVICVLRNVRKSVLFYKYVNQGVYEKLKEKIQELEDVLVKSNSVDLDEKYVEFYNCVTKLVQEIYQIVAEQIF